MVTRESLYFIILLLHKDGLCADPPPHPPKIKSVKEDAGRGNEGEGEYVYSSRSWLISLLVHFS